MTFGFFVISPFSVILFPFRCSKAYLRVKNNERRSIVMIFTDKNTFHWQIGVTYGWRWLELCECQWRAMLPQVPWNWQIQTNKSILISIETHNKCISEYLSATHSMHALYAIVSGARTSSYTYIPLSIKHNHGSWRAWIYCHIYWNHFHSVASMCFFLHRHLSSAIDRWRWRCNCECKQKALQNFLRVIRLEQC